MECKKVIMVRDSPYSFWEEERFGVHILQSFGMEVELWNVGPVFQPLGSQIKVEPPKIVDPLNFYDLSNFGYACRQLSENDILIFMCGFTPSNIKSHLRMWQIAAKSKAKLAVVVQGGMPRVKSIFRVESRSVFLRKLRGFPYWMFALLNRRTGGKVFRSVQKKLLGLRSLDYIWAGTTTESVDPVLVSPRTKVTSIHNFDYDSILEINSSSREVENVALYIDHMGYNHPDYFSLGYVNHTRNDSIFFSELELAFVQIEKQYGVTVEIAAHPRAPTGSLRNCYPSRKIHHHQTLEKVKTSRVLLLTSASTVVGAAAALEVPILGIISPAFLKDFAVELNSISRNLDFPLLVMDQKDLKWPELSVNIDAYGQYVNSYFKFPETSRLRFWEEISLQLTSKSSN